MESKTILSISVQNLIEFSRQSGDLGGTGFFSSARAVEGTRGHNTVRKAFRASLPVDASYTAELPVSYRLEGKYVILEVSGRIDGVIESPSGITIHEIKTTVLALDLIDKDYNRQHWDQVKCYAFMYAALKGLDAVDICLTYYQLDSGLEKLFFECCSFEELGQFFRPLAEAFLEWQDMLCCWQEIRNNSISGLEFPYQGYRKGQQELISGVCKAIESGSLLFAQAPTGTGKTVAALYPAVKALGEGKASKIFYLTAKTTTRAIAEKAVNDMRIKGLRIKSVTITAKEKTCFNSGLPCDAELCEYAKNYNGKIRDTLKDTFSLDFLDRNTIEAIAIRHAVCPFELSLDISLFCDIIICDYNYLFDPRVYLKRFFMQQRGDWCFLIDEAHNLVDRAREMYSAEISKRAVSELRRAIKSEMPGLFETINRLHKYLSEIEREYAEKNESDAKIFLHVAKTPPEGLYALIGSFTAYIEDWLPANPPVSFQDKLLDAYFDFIGLLKILDAYNEGYVTYYEKTPGNFKLKLFCIDPSSLLKEAMGRGRSSILFSATLSPLDYFTRLLGGDGTSSVMVLASPFPRENLCIYVDDTISTKYKTRQLSYDRIAESILTAVSGKTGNYMAFFPSFEYLEQVYFRFMGIKSGIRTIYQIRGMSEAARQQFLDEFDTSGETSLAGFAVMGGVFGEGIDLTGEKLSGAVIVGVGLPQICNERNIIRQYFDEQTGTGFEFAYVYPGINRVLQAAGRVIRTETDRGIVVLLDERFSSYSYKELLPAEWHPIPRAADCCLLSEVLEDFWSESE